MVARFDDQRKDYQAKEYQDQEYQDEKSVTLEGKDLSG